jgi:YHS domain-containing protein
MPIDPICQMTVDEGTDLRAEHDEQTYYFCSPYCVEAFKKDPARFVKSAAPADARQPNNRKPSVAIDPVCGMTVDPNTAAEKYEYNGQTYFFCSQHCLAKFKEDPEKFLNSRTNEQRHARMHLESEHPHPDLPPSETVSQLRCDSVIEGGGAASRATQYRDYAIELRFFS